MLTQRTRIWVIDKKTGDSSESTLDGWFNSLIGGSKWDDYEVTTNLTECHQLRKKYAAIARMREVMLNMTVEQAEKAVHLVQSKDELMDLDEQYV